MSKKIILAVDDDPAMQSLYFSIFRRHAKEFVLQLSPSGEDALFLLEQKKPDLLLLDWNLPGINGIEVLKRVRSNETTKSLPVIMVTSEEEPTKRIAALEEGADQYMSKYFLVDELIVRIRRELRRRDGGLNPFKFLASLAAWR